MAEPVARAGMSRGDTVAVVRANSPALLEAHYGVPMLGAVLNPINIRLDAPLIAFCLEHGEAKLLLADRYEISQMPKFHTDTLARLMR